MRRAAQSAARSLALAASRRAAGTAEITPAAAGLALARAGEQRAVSVALQPLLLSCRVGDKHQLRQLISQPCRAMRRSHFLPSAAAAACSSCLQTPGPSLPALLAQLGRTISTPPAHLRRAPHLPTPSSASCRSRQVGCRARLPQLHAGGWRPFDQAGSACPEGCTRPSPPTRLPAAYVVERFGKYSRTLTPGLHVLIPIVSWAACGRSC